MKKILTIIFIFASLFASSQELMNKNFEGFRVKVSELVIDNDTLNTSGTGGIEANSIDVDTMKLNGVPLLLNAFKKDSLGGAGNIFYSTGASSQPASGTVNQVTGGGLLNANSVVKWDGSKFANTGIIENVGYFSINQSELRFNASSNSVGNLGQQNATTNQYSNNVGHVGQQNATNNQYSNNVGNNGQRNATTNTSSNNVGNAGQYNATTNQYSNNVGNNGQQNATTNQQSNNVGYDGFRYSSTGLPVVSITKGLSLGHNTRCFDTISTNEIVIGADAVGHGDNTATFGNMLITDNYFNGNLIADTIKARADIIVTGEIYDEINHLYGMVYDSTITLSLTQNVWQQVTNPTKTLYSTAEQNGVTISGDTIVFSKAGGYDVYFEINCTGIDSKDYHYRILQENGTTTVRSYNKYASTGTQVVRNEKAYVHVAAGSKVWCEIMSSSSAPGSITIQGAKVYAMQRYLEK